MSLILIEKLKNSIWVKIKQTIQGRKKIFKSSNEKRMN
jgi:hypothetical protein